MDWVQDIIIARFNYWIYVILMMIGLYAMITKKNLIKKLIGMSIFQTAIILFFVSIGAKEGSTIPILDHHGGGHGEAAHAAHDHAGEAHEGGAGQHHILPEPVAHSHDGSHAEMTNPDDYANPLPHVLMLTAIVVGVATLGVGLAVTQVIFRHYGTIEEDELLKKIRDEHG